MSSIEVKYKTYLSGFAQNSRIQNVTPCRLDSSSHDP
jgi:hypothetical protein